MKRLFLSLLCTTAAVWLAPDLLAAESSSETPNEQELTQELKAREDPTILLRRVWAETEWNKFKDGSHLIEETLGGLWSWRVSPNQEWAVRLKVPFDFHVAGDTAGDSDEQGLGDIKLATGTALRLSDSWRAGGGVEMKFPSATEDDLGASVWQPQLFGAVAWDVSRCLTLSPSFEYNKSIEEEDGADQTHFLELFFPVTWVLPNYWSIAPRYEAKVDFENDGYWTHSAKIALTKQLVKVPLGFSLSFKKTFDGGNKEFQINLVATYYFR